MQTINENKEKIENAGFVLYRPKKVNSKVQFSQVMQTNSNYLVRKGYLTSSEKVFLFDIQGLIGFESNAIVKTINKVQIALTQEEIAKIIGKSYRSVNSNVNSLVEKGILAKAKTGLEHSNALSYTLYVNPNLYFNGDKAAINETLKTMFHKVNKKEKPIFKVNLMK